MAKKMKALSLTPWLRRKKATKIEATMIPSTVLFDDRGRKAHCALVMNRQEAAEFDRRVADLYA